MDAQRTAPVDAPTNPGTAERDGSRRGAPHVVADYELTQRGERFPLADTFLAVHRSSGTPRVLYVLRPAAMQDRALVHRAVYEVDTARWIRHQAVPRVDPCGETPEGRLYIAVEHRAGDSLGAAVAANGKLDVANVVRTAARVVEALDAAHSVGLVHARLTPASLVLAEPDERGRRDVSLIGLGTTAATARPFSADDLAYTSPEQLRGATPDALSDLFSLASVLQLALTGVPPMPVMGRYDVDMSGVDLTTAAGVIAIARSADPAARHPGVKAFWDDLLGALVREGNAAADGLSAAVAAAVPVALMPVAIPPSAPARDASVDLVAADAPRPAFDAPLPAFDAAAAMPAGPTSRVVWRRAAVALVAAGLAGAAGLARAVGGPSQANVAAANGALSIVRGPVSARPTSGVAEPAAAAPVARPNAAPVAAARASEKSDIEALAAVPRIDSIAIPEVSVATAAPPHRELVRADEFVPMTEPRHAPSEASTVDARREAQRAIDAYARALSARDVEALNRAAPGMASSARARWAQLFRTARRIEAELVVVEARVDGDMIAARVRSRIDVRLRGVSRPVQKDATSDAVLVRDSTGWRVWSAP